MRKKLLILLMVIITFSGCTTKTEYVYIKAKCPKIEVLPKVAPIDVVVESTTRKDGNTSSCICGKYKDNVFDGIKALRKNENYYIKQINKYNKEFTNESR